MPGVLRKEAGDRAARRGAAVRRRAGSTGDHQSILAVDGDEVDRERGLHDAARAERRGSARRSQAHDTEAERVARSSAGRDGAGAGAEKDAAGDLRLLRVASRQALERVKRSNESNYTRA